MLQRAQEAEGKILVLQRNAIELRECSGVSLGIKRILIAVTAAVCVLPSNAQIGNKAGSYEICNKRSTTYVAHVARIYVGNYFSDYNRWKIVPNRHVIKPGKCAGSKELYDDMVALYYIAIEEQGSKTPYPFSFKIDYSKTDGWGQTATWCIGEGTKRTPTRQKKSDSFRHDLICDSGLRKVTGNAVPKFGSGRYIDANIQIK